MMLSRVLSTMMLASVAGQALAADVRAVIDAVGNYRTIVIEGPIIRGDCERFLQVVRENQNRVAAVYLFTPGGDFDEAMKIGRAMRALELHSMVPMRNDRGQPVVNPTFGPQPNDVKNATCASAGFFIHIGAMSRGGTYLAVHRPCFDKEDFAKLSEHEARISFDELQARAIVYMNEMAVPTQIQEQLLATPSDKILVLEEQTVRQFFWGTLPHRDEWLKAKCAILSEAEESRLSKLSDKLQANSKLLTDAEVAEFMGLQAKKDQQSAEQRKLVIASRAAAYEKFFGMLPSDAVGHNFSRWQQAFRYIGQRYADLEAEEKFVPSKLGGISFLSRSATATSPYISLSDAAADPMRVDEVSIISHGGPSDQFRSALLAALATAWGEPVAVDALKQWNWVTKDMDARLQLHPESPYGPYFDLRIRKR